MIATSLLLQTVLDVGQTVTLIARYILSVTSATVGTARLTQVLDIYRSHYPVFFMIVSCILLTL